MNKFDDSKVRHWNLVSGESIVGYLLGIDRRSKSVVIEYPMQVIKFFEEGNVGYTMTPWNQLATPEKPVVIRVGHIVTESNVRPETVSDYVSAVLQQREHDRSHETRVQSPGGIDLGSWEPDTIGN